MSFLAPLFLLGGLAVAAPILFHLIRRSVRDRAQFSSLMFLNPTPPQRTRRRKLEHLWLLILRCLILLALTAGFARPYFTKDVAPPDIAGTRRQLVILIDTSASMRRAGLWNKARAVADGYLDKTAPTDEVAVMAFDRQARTVVSMAEWASWPADQRAALARERLAGVSPGWMGTELGPALLDAAGQLESHSGNGSPATRRNLVLISDLQEGAKLDGLQGHEWPAGARVTVERVETQQSNAGLEIPEASTGTVRVANSKDSRKEKFHLAWQGGGDGTEIYLPPGQTRSFPTPKLPAGSATGVLQLTGDDADFDNTSYFAAPEVQEVAICYVGADSTNDPAKPLYYLERVFPATPRRRVKVTGPDSLNQAGFAVVPGALSASEITSLRDWLSGGKSALLLLAPGDQSGATLAGLLGLPDIQITEGTGDYALLGEIDFKHPIFAPFDDPRYGDFTPIHFWKHRRWEIPASLNASALAKFDDGSPALAQVAVGNGNLLVLASGWEPSDSQLAVSSKFPPLMETMLDWSGSGAPARFQFRTGDAIPAPHFSGDSVQWKKPDGTLRTLPAAAAFAETESPGIYVAAAGGKERRFAVNLPLEESRVAPLSQDELARLGVPLGPVADEPTAATRIHQRQLQQTELENSQKLWRWFILAALAIAGVEIILAGSLARPAKPEGATP